MCTYWVDFITTFSSSKLVANVILTLKSIRVSKVVLLPLESLNSHFCWKGVNNTMKQSEIGNSLLKKKTVFALQIQKIVWLLYLFGQFVYSVTKICDVFKLLICYCFDFRSCLLQEIVWLLCSNKPIWPVLLLRHKNTWRFKVNYVLLICYCFDFFM